MKGFITNIEKRSLENDNFREVLYTDHRSQLVLMSLPAGEDIGEEVHDVDQFLRVEKGTGRVIMSDVSHDIADGSVIVVPAGTKHNVINTGGEAMKLYTIYMPPHHRDGVVHKTKAEGEADLADEFDGTTTEISGRIAHVVERVMHMQKLHLSIVINAPKEKVWHTMLDDAPYRQWTTAFSPGSYYVGDWSVGSKMFFLGPNPEGPGEMGMVSRMAANRQYEFISIEHLGIMKDGVEDTTSELAKKWAPAFENYTFAEVEGGTEVRDDMDIEEEHAALFEEMWVKALQQLKALAE